MAQMHRAIVDKLATTIATQSSRLALLEKKVVATQTLGPGVSTTITFSATPPLGPHVGDVWYMTDAFGNITNVYQWNGSSWGPLVLGTGGIANGAVTNALLAANSVGNTNIQGSAVGQSNLQSGSVGSINLQTYAVGAGQALTQFSGQNMIVDGQFTNSSITAARLTDGATIGSWSLSSAPVGSPFTIGHSSSSSATSIGITPGTAAPAGCAILVSVLEPGGAATYSASDTQGNTYTLVSTQNRSGLGNHLILGSLTGKALSTGDTITVTKTGAAAAILAVAYGVPLGNGYDGPQGFGGSGSTMSFTTKANQYPGDVNIVFINNINGLTVSAGGGAPAGWTYAGGSTSGALNYVTEICWEYAPTTAGQPFTTHYASSPAAGWLDTTIGITNSGGSGHMGVTATTTPAVLPLMPSAGSQPSMYVNPGEQYYLSMIANVPGATAANSGVQLVTDGGVLTVSKSGTGYQAINGTVTIPPGATNGYVRVFTTASSGTISGISILNPSASMSQLSGASWTLNDSGLLVTEPANPGGPNVHVHVNAAANAPAIDMATNLGTEASGPSIYVNGQSVGTSTEFETMWMAGPSATVDSNSVSVIMSSSTKDGSTAVASGALVYNTTPIFTWGSGGVGITGGIGASSIHTSGVGEFDGGIQVGATSIVNSSAAITQGTFASGVGISAASIHTSGVGEFDGGITTTAGTAISSSNAFTGASIHVSGAGQFDSGISGSLGISGFASIHTSGAGQFDGGISYSSGISGDSIHTSANGVFDGSVTVGSGVSITSGGFTGASIHVSGAGIFDSSCATSGGISGASIHTSGAGQFDGGITYTGGCNGSSVHTSGVVKADGGFQGPTISGLPLSGTQTLGSLGSAINLIYAAIT